MEGMFKCKNCGAEIDLSRASNGLIECDFCLSRFTLPKEETSPAALDFLRQGEHHLDTSDFDDAYTAYAKALEYDQTEPEAYWGMALAERKVRYIKDSVKNCLRPIYYGLPDKEFAKNKNYLKALRFATKEQKSEYEKKAQEIDYIRDSFFDLEQSHLDYDCFICVKVSRTDSEQSDISRKNWTDDAFYAESLYTHLKEKGYKPFFSEMELKNRTGADYEAFILYALHTCETMLVVCFNEEYLTSSNWVKNEYMRFRKLINSERKAKDSLTIIYDGKPIDQLPGQEFGRIQGINRKDADAFPRIVDFVENHTPMARAKREEEKRKKEEAEKHIAELQDQIEAIRRSTVAGSTPAQESLLSLLTRAAQELEMGDLNKAGNYYNHCLDIKPDCLEAWYGLLLIDYNSQSDKALIDKIRRMDGINKSSYSHFLNFTINKSYIQIKKHGNSDNEISNRLKNIEAEYFQKIWELCVDIRPDRKEFYQEVCNRTMKYDLPIQAYASYDLFIFENECVSHKDILKKIDNCDKENAETLFEIIESISRSDGYFQYALHYGNEKLKGRLNDLLSRAEQKKNQIVQNLRSDYERYQKNYEECKKKTIQCTQEADSAKGKYINVGVEPRLFGFLNRTSICVFFVVIGIIAGIIGEFVIKWDWYESDFYLLVVVVWLIYVLVKFVLGVISVYSLSFLIILILFIAKYIKYNRNSKLKNEYNLLVEIERNAKRKETEIYNQMKKIANQIDLLNGEAQEELSENSEGKDELKKNT